jgi:hypothetical protein
MSVKVIRALLVGAAAVTAKVPAAQIAAGVVKEGTPLPAYGLTEIGLVPVGAIDGQAEYSVVTSRVQVTAMAKSYPEVKELLDLARRACNFQRGRIAGLDVVSVVRATVGPDLEDDAGQHFQSIDFMVTYHEQN